MLYKVFKGANMALSMTALIMADSLGSALAVFMTLVMFGVYCWRCEKNRLKSVFAVYLILLLINIMMYSLVDTFFASIVQMVFDVGKIVNDSDDVDRVGSGRGELWRYAVEHIVRRPLTGWGVEGYEYGDTAHNELLQYAENFGIPVTLMYISAVTYVLTATFRRKKNLSKITLSCFCSTTSYLIGSLFGLALFNTLPFFYLFLGLTYAEVARSMILKSEKTETVTGSGENAE
jgi:O-antigen ligase